MSALGFAILDDPSRKAGLRVVSVRIHWVFESLCGALAEEIATDRGRYLHFDRLVSRKRIGDLPRKFRAALAARRQQLELTAPDEKSAIPATAGAGADQFENPS